MSMSQQNMDRYRRMKGPLVAGGPYCYGKAHHPGWTPQIQPILFTDYVDAHEEAADTNFYSTKALVARHTDDSTDRKLLLKSQYAFSRPAYIAIAGNTAVIDDGVPGQWDNNITRDLYSMLEIDVSFITEVFDLEAVTWNSLPALSAVLMGISTGVTGVWSDTSAAQSDPQNITSLSFSAIGDPVVRLQEHLVPSAWPGPYYGVLIHVKDTSVYKDDGGSHGQGVFTAVGISDGTAVTDDPLSFILTPGFTVVAR